MDLKDKIYLDNAATTPVFEEVMMEMIPYMRIAFGNPSSTHSFGRETRAAIELSRKKIASLLHVKASEIIFTSSGTEANNLAIANAIVSQGRKHVITSKTEHNAVLKTIQSYSPEITIHYLTLNAHGNIDLEELKNLIEVYPDAFLSLMWANNEIGTILDLEGINALLEGSEILFHSDAVQWIGHYAVDLSKYKNLHMLTASAHKFHGPKGAAFLYIKKGVKSGAQITGGPQERELRAGTENVASIVGMAKALDLSLAKLEEHKRYVEGLKKYVLSALKTSFPDLKVNGSSDKGLYTIINVSFPPHKSREMLPFALDLQGIAVSAGSACSSGSTAFSHVLRAIGSRDDWPAIRISLSHLNSKNELDRLVSALEEILKNN